jgi:3-oxoacyl-[acyl-carrier protein] reductase
MKKNNYGRIINTASLTVKEPLSNLVLSNTIRAAVAIWAKTLAKDIAPFGITVNTILTGLFDTERIKQLNKIQASAKKISLEKNLKQMTQEIPSGRLGKPEEFGYLIAFLASNYSSYITGTNISIDGGLIKSL